MEEGEECSSYAAEMEETLAVVEVHIACWDQTPLGVSGLADTLKDWVQLLCLVDKLCLD